MTSVLRTLLIALAVLAVSAPTASAASRNAIIRDCSDDGRLSREYTKSELRDARNNLPADVDEYTDCRDVLRRAELGDPTAPGGAAGGGSGPTSPGATNQPLLPETGEEHHELRLARESAGDPVSVGGREVVPGAKGFASYAARHDLPWLLIAVLALIALGTIAAAAPAIRRRVLARRAAPA